MAEVNKAIRWQNYIEVTYSCGKNLTGQICIDANNTTRYKQISQTGDNCRVCFRFPNDAEAQKFLVAYIKDEQNNQITDEMRIVDIPLEEAPKMTRPSGTKSVRRDPIRTQEYRIPKTPYAMAIKWGKELALGIVISLFTMTLFLVMCSSSKVLHNFNIHDAYFQDGQNILVLGRLEWDIKANPQQRQEACKETFIQLWVHGKMYTEVAVHGESFQIVLPYTDIPEKNAFSVKPRYKKNIFQENAKEVVFRHGYPIATIHKAEFDQKNQANVGVRVYSDNPKDILVSIAEEKSNAILEQQILSETREVIFQPVEKHGIYRVFLQSTSQQKKLDEKLITPICPIGKIHMAIFNNLHFCQIAGTWDGAKDISQMMLLIWNADQKTVSTSQTIERNFHNSFRITDIRAEYQAQIVYNNQILYRTPITKPPVFYEYFQALDDISTWIEQTDRSLQYLQEESWKLGIQNFIEILSKAKQHQQTCSQISPLSKEELDIARISHIYSLLEQIAKIVLSYNEKLPSSQKSEIFTYMMNENFVTLQEILGKFQNCWNELEQKPSIRNPMAFLQQKVQLQYKKQRIEKTVLSIETYCEAGQYELAADVASQAWQEYGDIWQFLLARCLIYRCLSQHPDYPQRSAWFVKKSQEDADRLLEILKPKFQKMFPDNNLPEAYVLGMALLQVRADTNISQKIEEVKSKVSLDTLISFYKQSLHIRIVKRF